MFSFLLDKHFLVIHGSSMCWKIRRFEMLRVRIRRPARRDEGLVLIKPEESGKAPEKPRRVGQSASQKI